MRLIHIAEPSEPHLVEMCIPGRGMLAVTTSDTDDAIVLAVPGSGNPPQVERIVRRYPGGLPDHPGVYLSREVLSIYDGQPAASMLVARADSVVTWLMYQVHSAVEAHAGRAVITPLAISLFDRAMALGRPVRGRVRASSDLVGRALQLLRHDPTQRLDELARDLGTSPFHLSRSFARHLGVGIARFRISLRLHRALDLLAAGETDLARVAADSGFSDQAHLTRTMRLRLGVSPGEARAEFARIVSAR